MRIRLSDEDRKRLGVGTEWISYTVATLMLTESEALERVGYDPDDFTEEMRGIPVVDDAGAPVMVKVLGPDGGLVEEQKVRWPRRAVRAMVWLALRRAGVTVPYADFDVDTYGIEYAPDEDEQPAGKDEAPPSAKPASGTRLRSRRSSASARGRSTS